MNDEAEAQMRLDAWLAVDRANRSVKVRIGPGFVSVTLRDGAKQYPADGETFAVVVDDVLRQAGQKRA